MFKKNKKLIYFFSFISIGVLSFFACSLANNIDSIINKQQPTINNRINIVNDSIVRQTTNSTATYIDTEELIANFQKEFNLKQYVYNVNQNDIKKIIYKYVKNPPGGFVFRDIQFDLNAPSGGWEVDGINGRIKTTIILTKFINENGQVQTTNFPPVVITFGDFYPAPGVTTSETSISIDASTTLPQDVYDDEKNIMKYLENNNVVKNLPLTSKILLSNYKFSNSEGFISFDISVDGYFIEEENSKFVFHLEPKVLVNDFKIYGFKVLSKTIAPSAIRIPNVSNVLPSSYLNNISEIKKNIFNALSQKPSSMSYEDILIDQVVPENNSGILEVDYSCINAYDEIKVANTANKNGKDVVLVNKITKKEPITLIGFLSASPTIFPEIITLSDSNNILAQNVSNDEIKQHLLSSISNINNINITLDNINVNTKQVDNLTGSIIVYPKLDKYITNDGFIYDIPGEFIEFPPITIEGYKHVTQTSLVPTPDFTGDSSILATDALKNIDIIKNIILKNLTSVPDGFNNDNIIILNSSPNNKAGTITISFTINKYYDSTGFLINDQSWPVQLITIRGFKQTSPTIIKKHIALDNVSNIPPYEYSDEQLISYIKNNIDTIISPLPEGFSIENNLMIQQINKYNTQGYIEAFIKVNYFYDSLGNVVTNDALYSMVRFVGFSSIKPTSIKDEIFLTSVSNISVADINENALKDLLFDNSNPQEPTSVLIENFPKNGIFTKDNIFVRIVDRISSNSESYIVVDVSLNTYYDKDGFLVQNSKFLLEKFNIKISGFKKTNPTEIFDSFRIPPSSEYSKVYPSDVAIWENDSTNGLSLEKLIKDNLNSFLSSYPSDVKIKNIIVKNVINSTGTLIINLQILNYYNSIGKTEDVIVLSKDVSISGFTPIGSTIVNTNFEVSNVYDILASNISSDDLLEIIWTNRKFIFTNLPSNFKKTDIEINLDENAANNIKGEITANVSLYNYFDIFGAQQTTIPLKNKIIFSGFKQILPTKIVSNISISKPGINKVLPSDFSDKELLQYLFDAKSNIFINLPNEFTINSIIFSSGDVVRNNLTGEITINPISISVYYDDYGNLINNTGVLLTSSLTISGFGSISIPTTIDSEVNVQDTNYWNFLPSDITIDMLKNIMIEKTIIKNHPPSFSILDIVSGDSDIKKRDNLTGQVILEVRIKNYYNDQGLIVNNLNNTLNLNVTFKGFKCAIPTIANDTVLTNVGELIASKIVDNELLQIVRKNYNSIFSNDSLPDGFSEINIQSVRKLSHDNLTGSIVCRIGLDRYYDEDASLVSNGLIKSFDITISGFHKLLPTRLIRGDVIVSNQNKLASDLSFSDVSQIIYDNISFIFENLPIDFFKSNIEIINLSPNNNLGHIKVDFALNYYINDFGDFIKTNENTNFPNKEFKIIISGFKSVSQTKIKDSYRVSGQIANILPSEIKINNILRLIANNPNDFIENPYLGSSSITSDILVSNLRPNNLNGTLTFTLTLLKYYNENGLLVTESNSSKLLTKDFVLTGFISQQKTIFIDKVYINKEDILPIPQLIKNDQLVNIIFENKGLFFKNLPSDFVPNNIVIESIDKTNNLDGSMLATIRITNFYDNNGILELNEFHRYKVLISGFKKIKSSSIVDDVRINNFSSIQNNVASYFFNNPNVLKDLIVINRRSIFFNMPPYFEDQVEFSKILNVNPVSYNNSLGYIDVELAISEYYDNDGTLIKNQSILSKKVRIHGFTVSYSTQIITEQIVVQDASNYNFPSEISNNEIEYIIKNQYPEFLSQLPQNFNRSNIINIQKINANDIEGTVLVKFSLNLYYNQEGVVISNGELFNGKIILTGFNSKKASIFIDKFGRSKALGTFQNESIVVNLPNVYPSQINQYYSTLDPNNSLTLEQQREKVNDWLFTIVASKLDYVENMSKENIFVQFRENIFSDQEGYIEASVKVLSYISEVEGGLTNTPTEFIIKIEGLKEKVTSNELKNNTLVVVISILSVAAAIAIVSFLVFLFRFRIWRR